MNQNKKYEYEKINIKSVKVMNMKSKEKINI